MDRKEAVEKGFLQNKVVKLKPIFKEGKMIKDKKHIGYFMFDGAFKNYTLPRNPKTNSYKQIFNEEELKFFSSALQTDLSFTRIDDNYWDTHTIRIKKDESLMKHGISFDLSDPYQNLDFRIMKSLRETAPSYKERFDSPKYRWYIAEENEELIHENKQMEELEAIYTFFGSIKGSKKKMIDLISVYNSEKASTKIIGIDSDIEWYRGEVRKIIKKDPSFIVQCMNDEDYQIKAMVADGVRSGAINKPKRNVYNIIGDSSNYDFNGLVKRLNGLKANTDDEYFRIEAQIKDWKKQNKLK